MFFDKEKLISEIQQRPSIWQVSSNEYKNSDVKDVDWEEITRQIFPECSNVIDIRARVPHLKKKWNNIRDCYRKYLKELKDTKSSELSRKKRKYIFADMLEFLRPVLESRNFESHSDEVNENDESSLISAGEELFTITTYPVRSPKVQSKRDNDNASSVTSTHEEQHKCLPLLPESTRVRRKKRNEGNESIEGEILEILKARRTGRNSEEDGDKSFLISFLPDMRSLNEMQKLQFKKAMLDLMANIKFQTNIEAFPKNEVFRD